MGEIVKFNPGKIETVEEIFEELRRRGVTKILVVGISPDNEPYIEATSNTMLMELSWMVLSAHNAVTAWMRK